MGIGGLDSEFGAIFRRAFASRVFPPGLVEKLGIQHVKGMATLPRYLYLLIYSTRYSTFWTSGNRKDPYGETDRKDAKRPRAKNRERPRNSQQVCWCI